DRCGEVAIVVPGSMVMVRLTALMEVGGWGSDSIVEDSELGLRLFEAGHIAHYTNRRYGYGLLPDPLEAF
ncbi:glycosyltransferase family 2 protein, partial [Aliarcobacter butzleri]|uniref:glycosyltransferase family 2 protein n=1 Tax=Aliarcobacter butzleri TaxID=28197 RepID=UPI003AF4D57D